MKAVYRKYLLFEFITILLSAVVSALFIEIEPTVFVFSLCVAMGVIIITPWMFARKMAVDGETSVATNVGGYLLWGMVSVAIISVAVISMLFFVETIFAEGDLLIFALLLTVIFIVLFLLVSSIVILVHHFYHRLFRKRIRKMRNENATKRIILRTAVFYIAYTVILLLLVIFFIHSLDYPLLAEISLFSLPMFFVIYYTLIEIQVESRSLGKVLGVSIVSFCVFELIFSLLYSLITAPIYEKNYNMASDRYFMNYIYEGAYPIWMTFLFYAALILITVGVIILDALIISHNTGDGSLC